MRACDEFKRRWCGLGTTALRMALESDEEEVAKDEERLGAAEEIKDDRWLREKVRWSR